MAVPEPMPDRRLSRGTILRRASFAASVLALVIAFALTLSGIASTQATLKPDGQAAAIAAKQRSGAADRSRDCPRDVHRERDPGDSGRV